MSQPNDKQISPPARATDEADRPFWDAIDCGELRLARCRKCRRHFVRAQACTGCGAGVPCMEWVLADGRGVLKTFSVFEKSYHPYFDQRVPYVVAIVRLREEVDLLTNLLDVNPPEIRVGMPVRMVIRRRGEFAIHQAIVEPHG
jgi:uncharacterized OB-fold protein